MKTPSLAVASSMVASSMAFSSAFVHRAPRTPAPRFMSRTSSVVMMAWTPDRGPETNPLRAKLSVDASFSREAIRADVDYMDNDQQNPPSTTKWWEAYYPTKEEQEAAAAGFDFSNPEEWLATKPKVDLSQPTEFIATESFTAKGREWPELKKEIKA